VHGEVDRELAGVGVVAAQGVTALDGRRVLRPVDPPFELDRQRDLAGGGVGEEELHVVVEAVRHELGPGQAVAFERLELPAAQDHPPHRRGDVLDAQDLELAEGDRL
jgi:hypothetical protein